MNELLQSLHELKPLLLPLLLPPGPLLVLLLLGAGLLRRHRWLGRGLLGAGLLGTWFAFTEVGADGLQRALLGPVQALDAAALERLRLDPADSAVLVLGAGAQREAPEYGGPTLKPLSLERLRYGVWLARRTGLPLGFTGGPARELMELKLTEAALARQAAREEWQLPLRWAEDRSRDTRENARMSLPLLRQDGVRRVLLVTHGQHMPRALRAFGEAAAGLGIEVVPAPLGLRPTTPYSLGDWFPSSDAIRKTRYVVYEWLGLRSGR
ncbi:YdcF family protein [Roseateles sp. DAIF2]|uniref:YdcF family protein n=1 Tax=Roseateles sp. DAIF2 TaxID=2714952 RepID=UPI0018A2ACDC|nr:YdcF family protein [Roseateles sp. DAIF2]QPF73854.1 YdcF family protein [Roseateles sp. DAIF2]